MVQQGKAAVVEDAFDIKSPKGSGSNTPARSRLVSPAHSVNGTPAASGDENSGPTIKKKKKKMNRNQLKAQEERR